MTQTPHPTSASLRGLARGWRRAVHGAVVFALLMAQWLAAAHGVQHAQLLHADVAHQAHEEAGEDAAHEAWGHHAGAPECALIDQLLVGQATSTAVVVMVAPLPSAQVAPCLQQERCSLPLQAYEARAPPAA